jgi:hypothetical protein
VVTGVAILLVLVLVSLFVVLGACMLLAALPKGRRSGLVAVTEEGVTLDGKLVCARRELRQGFATDGRHGPIVRLRRRAASSVDVELATADDASALLQAIGQHQRQTALAFEGLALRPRVYWGFIGFCVADLGVFLLAVPAMLQSPGLMKVLNPLLCALVIMPILAWVVPRVCTVVVGVDGVLVWRMFRREFYPYRSIRRAQREGSALVLGLVSGKTVHLTLGVPSVSEATDSESHIAVDALLARIAEARSVAPSSSPDVATALARGDRDASAWLAAVRGLLEPAGYRTGSVPREHVWNVLEDGTQPVTTRAAAATALRTSLGDEGRVRLRLARQACASKELAEVLATVEEAEADDDAIEKALRSLRA